MYILKGKMVDNERDQSVRINTKLYWINPRNNNADFTFNKYLSEDKYFAKKKRTGETKVIGYK